MSAKISPLAKGLALGSVAAAMLVLAGSNAWAQDATKDAGKDAAKPERFHHGPPHFSDLDTNHDGNVDKAEFTAPMLKHFEAMDANHDGVVSKAEFDDFIAKHMHGRHGHDGMDGPPPDGRGPHGHEGWHHGDGDRDGHPMGPPNLMDMDTNHDGKISFDEFTAHMKAHFDKLDTNHDGFIEDSELPHPPMGGDMPPPPPGNKPAGK